MAAKPKKVEEVSNEAPEADLPTEDNEKNTEEK
jgi:hypothetical protein